MKLNTRQSVFVTMNAWCVMVLLDYTFWTTGLIEQIPWLKYLLFAEMCLFCGYFSRYLSLGEVMQAIRKPWLVVGAFFLLVGLLLADERLQSLRLCGIIAVLSMTAYLSVLFLRRLDTEHRNILMLLMLIPLLLPPWLATLIALADLAAGPFTFLDSQSFEHSGNRWRLFNSSANGFGFDAAISLCLGAFGLVLSRRPVVVSCFFLLTIASLVALFFSSTRAAMIFAAVCGIVYLALSARPSRLVYVMCGMGALGIAGYLLRDTATADYLVEHLRLFGDWHRITSGRSTGYALLWDAVINSPFAGYGFGAMDRDFEIWPNNLFFVGILVEIGVFGAIGVLLLLGGPLAYVLTRYFVCLPLLCRLPPLDVAAVSVLGGLIFYQIFEFNIARVSMFHFLWMLCWAWLLTSKDLLSPSGDAAQGDLSDSHVDTTVINEVERERHTS